MTAQNVAFSGRFPPERQELFNAAVEVRGHSLKHATQIGEEIVPYCALRRVLDI